MIKKMYFLLLTTLIMLLGPPLLAAPLVAGEVIDYIIIETSQGIPVIVQPIVDPEVPLVEIVGFCWDSETSCGETRIFITVDQFTVDFIWRKDLSFWLVFHPDEMKGMEDFLSGEMLPGEQVPIGTIISVI